MTWWAYSNDIYNLNLFSRIQFCDNDGFGTYKIKFCGDTLLHTLEFPNREYDKFKQAKTEIMELLGVSDKSQPILF
jgi:hypothetical protein